MKLFLPVLVALVLIDNAQGQLVTAGGVERTNVPIDLYLAIDQSGSLSVKQFKDMITFGKKLSNALGNLTGWFSNVEDNGLRVCAITFVCGKTWPFIKPSGDPAFVNRKFDAIHTHYKPGGDTCLHQAIKLANGYIAEAEELITPPTRQNAFIVLTDGKFDDWRKFQTDLKTLSGGENTEVMSIGVGKRTNDNQLLGIAGGDEDKVFNLRDTDSLDEVLGTITSVLLDGFNSRIVRSGDKSDASDGACVGIPLQLQMTGLSIEGFSDNDNLVCELQLPDGTIEVPATVTAEAIYCDIPSLVDSYTDVPFLLYVFAGGKKLINEGIFSVTRKNCVTMSQDGTSDCLGKSITSQFSGGTISYWSAMVDDKNRFKCSFKTSKYSGEYITNGEMIGDTVKCEAPEQSTDWFVSEDITPLVVDSSNKLVDLVQPVSFETVSILFDADGNVVPIKENIQLEISDSLNETCANLLPGSDNICWADQGEMVFEGLNVAWIEQQITSSFEARCLFETSTDNITWPATIDNALVKCPIPSTISGEVQNLRVSIILMPVVQTTQFNRALLLSDQFHVKLTVDFCGSLLPLQGVGCLGEAIDTKIKLDTSNAIAKFESPGAVTCRFRDSDNPLIYIDVNPVKESQGLFRCFGEANVADLSIKWDTLEIRADGAIVNTFDLANDDGISSCFTYGIRKSLLAPFLPSELSVCWGYDSDKPTVRVSGTSASNLVTSSKIKDGDFSLICRYSSSSNVFNLIGMVEKPTVSALGEFECGIPDIFQSSSGSGSLKLEVLLRDNQNSTTVDSIVDATMINVNVLTAPPCFETILVKADNTPIVDSVCYGHETFAVITGDSVGLLSLYEDLTFSFLGSPPEPSLAQSSQSIRLKLPDRATKMQNIPANSSLELFGPSSGTISVAIPEYEVSQDCVQYETVIFDFNNSQLEEGADMCAGDSLVVTFIEDSLKFEDISNVSYSCKFTAPGVVRNVVPKLSSSGYLQCWLPVWGPFESTFREHINIDTLTLDTGLDQVSLIIPLEPPKVCMDDVGHAVDESLRPADSPRVSLRNLQSTDADGCWPSCCKRENVSLEFSGRTVHLLESSPERLRCAFTSAVDNETIYTSVSFPTPGTLKCADVPGWRYNTTLGDYSKATVQILDSSLTSVELVLDTFVYSPSSGSETCINVVREDTYCLGEVINFELNGLTMQALAANQQEFENTFTSDIQDTVNGTSTDLFQIFNGDAVMASWRKFVQPTVLDSLNVNMFMNQLPFFSSNLGQVNVGASARCANTADPVTYCPERNVYKTDVVVKGTVFEYFQSDQYVCSLYEKESDTRVDFTVKATYDNITIMVDCSTDSEEYQFDYFEIRPQGSEIVLYNMEIKVEKEGCSWNAGFITLFVLLGLLAFVIVVILAVCCYRRTKTHFNDQKSKPPVYPGPADSVPPPEAFKVGERVEARYRYKVDPSQNDWYKGTVTKVHHSDDKSKSAKYDIKYDDHLLESEEKVDAELVRSPQTDFRVGQVVEAKHVASGNWYKGTIAGVSKNDSYHVCYDNDLDDDYYVSGDFIREKGLQFKRDQVVAVRFPETPHVEERAIVMGVNSSANTYALKFDNNELGTMPSVNANFVKQYIINVDECVQVQDENDMDIWRRAMVTKVDVDQTFDVHHTNEDIGTEISVPLKRLRRPVFEVGDKVKVYTGNNWQQGIVEKKHDDRINYDIRLTLTEEMVTAANTHIQFQVLADIIDKVRQGKAMRTVNYEDKPEGPGMRPKNERFRTKRPLSYRELPDNQFEITIDSSEGLGCHLGWTDDRVIIAGWKDLENGDWGPLEASGLVMPKDEVIKINDIDVSGCGMAEVTKAIKSNPKRIRFRFGRASVSQEQVNVATT